MKGRILHSLIDAVALRTSSDPSPPSASRIITVYEQPLPIWVGAFIFWLPPSRFANERFRRVTAE